MGAPNQFDGLMHELCVGWGFCGCVTDAGEPQHVTDLIPTVGTVTSDEFAEWTLQAEWPRSLDDPEYAGFRKKWVKRIAGLFVKHMGSDTIDAALLKYGAAAS